MTAVRTFFVPIKTVSLTNQREHWRARHRRSKAQREAVAWIVPKGLPLPCVVTMTRQSPGILDDDNIRGALKHVRDQIAAQLGVDDRDPRVAWEYEQVRAKQYSVTIQIRPRE